MTCLAPGRTCHLVRVKDQKNKTTKKKISQTDAIATWTKQTASFSHRRGTVLSIAHRARLDLFYFSNLIQYSITRFQLPLNRFSSQRLRLRTVPFLCRVLLPPSISCQHRQSLPYSTIAAALRIVLTAAKQSENFQYLSRCVDAGTLNCRAYPSVFA